jgi:hypothetical protein
MTVRKLITFPERGAELLQLAIGESKERAAGEYLTAIMAQRRRAWCRALAELQTDGHTMLKITWHLKLFHARGYGFAEIDGYLCEPTRVAHQFYELLLEYDANNAELMAELNGG